MFSWVLCTSSLFTEDFKYLVQLFALLIHHKDEGLYNTFTFSLFFEKGIKDNKTFDISIEFHNFCFSFLFISLGNNVFQGGPINGHMDSFVIFIVNCQLLKMTVSNKKLKSFYNHFMLHMKFWRREFIICTMLRSGGNFPRTFFVRLIIWLCQIVSKSIKVILGFYSPLTKGGITNNLNLGLV